MQNLMPSPQMLQVVKSIETLSLKPYKNKGDVPTIGWGCTSYQDGRKVTLADKWITRQQAEDLFMFHVKNAVMGTLSTLNFAQVIKNLQWVFDASWDLVFNCGIKNVQFLKDRITPTRFVTYFNHGQFDLAHKELLNGWDRDSSGKQLGGLVRRRRFDYNVWIGNYNY